MPGASPLDSCSLCFLEDAFRVSTPKTTAFTRSLDSSHALPELEAKPRPPAMAVYGAAWLQPRAVHGAANKAACLVGARGVDGGAQAVGLRICGACACVRGGGRRRAGWCRARGSGKPHGNNRGGP